MFSRDDHDDLIARLYASSMGDTPWTATLARAADLFGASAALVQVSDLTGAPLAVQNHGYSVEFAAEFYASEVYANDPRVPYFRSIRPGTVYYDSNLYDLEEMDRNPWCQASCDILKVKYQLGAVSELPTGGTAAVTMLRSPDEGHASEDAIRAYRRLGPHIAQAMALGCILEQQGLTHAALIEALAGKAEGVILLSPAGAPTFLNDAAAAVLAAGDGLTFSAGAFVTRRGPETRRLQAMIGAAISAAGGAGDRPGGQMLVTRPSGLRPYALRVMPAPPVERFLSRQGAACVIYIQTLAAPPAPAKRSLRTIFGLTEREADLAVELVRSTNLALAAASARMSVNTARNHLQSIFRKTGTASQAEAVLLFSRLS